MLPKFTITNKPQTPIPLPCAPSERYLALQRVEMKLGYGLRTYNFEVIREAREMVVCMREMMEESCG